MQEIWPQILEILGKRLPSGQFKAWIATLVPVQEAGALVLCAQTEFAASHIRTWYGQLLEQAACEVLGPGCRVCIVCRASSAAQELILSPKESLPVPAAPFLPGAASLAASADHDDTGAVLSMFRQAMSAPRPLESPLTRQLENSQEQTHLGLPLVVSAERKSVPLSEPAWRHSFDDFVVGPCNELAYAASRSICNEAMHMDTLFLNSAPGLGKTHLMHAVGQSLGAACNRKRPHVECLTAEEFASRFYLSLKSQDTDRFKARYRTADLLLLEDVHFLQGKEKMQAELLATLKAVRERGGKVVFSSSFAPRDLKMMDEQLLSRFSSGLLTSIERPSENTRRKILRTKASTHHVCLPDEVEDILARHIYADVRQIESCLHTLILKAKLCNSRITPQMAWEVIEQYAGHTPILDLESIITYVCRGFGLSREQLHSSSRKQEYVCARNTAFFLARKHTDLSLEAIGRQFSRKHSTVLKGITSFEREMSRETPLGLQLSNILTMIERNGNITARPGQ